MTRMIFLGFGTNEKTIDRISALVKEVCMALSQRNITPLRHSSLWSFPALTDTGQVCNSRTPYINGVLELATPVFPKPLMKRLQEIESLFGRSPYRSFLSKRKAPRQLDLDLLDYHGVSLVVSHCLLLPHPRMMERKFVLAPLFELCPRWRHPTGKSIKTLLSTPKIQKQGGVRLAMTHEA